MGYFPQPLECRTPGAAGCRAPVGRPGRVRRLGPSAGAARAGPAAADFDARAGAAQRRDPAALARAKDGEPDHLPPSRPLPTDPVTHAEAKKAVGFPKGQKPGLSPHWPICSSLALRLNHSAGSWAHQFPQPSGPEAVTGEDGADLPSLKVPERGGTIVRR